MPNSALARAALHNARSSIIENVHGHHRRTFRAAVTFQRTDAKLVFKCAGHPFWKFFRTYQDTAQAGEILSGNTPRVSLQESRGGNHESDAVFPREFADNLRIQRAGMEYHAHTIRSREPQGYGKTERMEERQNAHEFVFARKRKHLRHLPNIGQHVMMREHHAFGLARASAGKNDGSQIVGGALPRAHRLLQQRIWQENGHEQRDDYFSELKIGQDIFQKNRASGDLNLVDGGKLLQKEL